MTHVHVGDCTTTQPGGLFHACLCDPPYELGFMGKDWDASGVAFHPDTWRKIGEHLHPGAFLMAFASSRGWHRLACAIEDAGFIIHPTIFGWAFGSGFPKATRIDTQVDKAAGEEGEMVARPIAYPDSNCWGTPNANIAAAGGAHEGGFKGIEKGGVRMHRQPATPLARAWAGHRYGLQALKPAVEPIIVAQKPYSGKPVDCITRTGAGALNVDGGRIATTDDLSGGTYGGTFSATRDEHGNLCKAIGSGDKGRWPANFILLDEEAAAALDRQSGVLPSSARPNSAGNIYERNSMFRDGNRETHGSFHTDTGGASRFFYNVQQQLDAADPIRYQAKASRRERDAGLEGLPEKADYDFASDNLREGGGRRVGRSVRNHHPTVKPIDLARYLATLLLPPAEYAPRRILVPFAGVGSEMIGAMLAGWDEVVGIEQDAEYAEIARLRIAQWKEQHQRATQEVLL